MRKTRTKPARVRTRSQKPKSKSSSSNVLSVRQRPVPAATNVRVQPGRPQSTSTKDGVRVRGAEVFLDVPGSVGFQTTIASFNPGLDSLPWLSNQAAGWEKYRVHGLKIRYVPSLAVTTTAGSVYLAFDYDASDGASSTLADLSAYDTMAGGRTFESFAVAVKPRLIHDSLQWKYMRSGGIHDSLRSYDAGIIIVSTVDMIGTDNIGRCWLEYDVEFVGRQVPTSRLASSVASFYSNALTINTGTNQDVVFNTTYDGLGTYYSLANSRINLPLGSYVIMWTGSWYGSGTGNNEAFVTLRDHNTGAATYIVSHTQDSSIDPDTAGAELCLAGSCLVGGHPTTAVSVNIQALSANNVYLRRGFLLITSVY